MLFRRKTIVCREGWYYLLVLVFVITGSILRDVNLLMVMSGMMFFPFFFNWRSAVLALRGLQLRRQLPRTITAGDLLVVNVELAKPRKRRAFKLGTSCGVVVDDHICNESAPAIVPTRTARLMFWRVAAGQCQRLSYQARLFRRGRYRLGPAVLSTGFPLGLVRHFRTQKGSDTIIVLPRPGRLTMTWKNLFKHSHVGTNSSRNKHGSHEGDFHSLRDWRTGDGHRWIHWRTTARRGEPVVRQFEQHREQDLAMLVDVWQPPEPDERDLETVERTISFAASIVADICRRGSSYLYLGSTGDEVSSHGGMASTGLMQDFLEQLAVAQADPTERLADLLGKTLDAIRPGMPIVVISPRPLSIAQLESDAELGNHPQRRAAAGRIEFINTSASSLTEYFEVAT